MRCSCAEPDFPACDPGQRSPMRPLFGAANSQQQLPSAWCSLLGVDVQVPALLAASTARHQGSSSRCSSGRRPPRSPWTQQQLLLPMASPPLLPSPTDAHKCSMNFPKDEQQSLSMIDAAAVAHLSPWLPGAAALLFPLHEPSLMVMLCGMASPLSGVNSFRHRASPLLGPSVSTSILPLVMPAFKSMNLVPIIVRALCR
ncbi:hypothetical protein U9M48_039793 [Paspalum notatum var. saurae]|uniref:Uncharacterized protein n=1 Tax=Paspalum notatum var. saurae TaxID=547442 RepID=A0AAQ3UK95_PASNO